MRCGPGCCGPRTCRADPVAVLGRTSSARIGTLVKDVVTETLAGGLTEIRMSDAVLEARARLRSFLFDAVYENTIATAEFKKASDILSGLWEKVRERPDEFLDAPDDRAARGSTRRPAISWPA